MTNAMEPGERTASKPTGPGVVSLYISQYAATRTAARARQYVGLTGLALAREPGGGEAGVHGLR